LSMTAKVDTDDTSGARISAAVGVTEPEMLNSPQHALEASRAAEQVVQKIIEDNMAGALPHEEGGSAAAVEEAKNESATATVSN